jgi:small subunit ribosomal protein S3
MGQKVNPNGLRLGITKDWQSSWFATKDYAKFLNNDIKIREYLFKTLKDAAVSEILIERKKNRTDIKINTAKPGIIIGQGGKDIEKLRNKIKKLVNEDIYITIVEVKDPALNAKLVADLIARQIENRGNFRTVQKKAIKETLKAGAVGIKTSVAGRLGGVEMARTEGYTEGTVPLHTLRANIDYATSFAMTTYGKIGVKVWIYKGEILPTKETKGGNIHVDAEKN